jgi:hypothetical protein
MNYPDDQLRLRLYFRRKRDSYRILCRKDLPLLGDANRVYDTVLRIVKRHWRCACFMITNPGLSRVDGSNFYSAGQKYFIGRITKAIPATSKGIRAQMQRIGTHVAVWAPDGKLLPLPYGSQLLDPSTLALTHVYDPEQRAFIDVKSGKLISSLAPSRRTGNASRSVKKPLRELTVYQGGEATSCLIVSRL